MTTALRWLDRLEAAALAERRPDPTHAMGVLVLLTAKGAAAMRAHLTAHPE